MVGGSSACGSARVSEAARRAWFQALVEPPLASGVAALLDDRWAELAGTVPAAPSGWAVGREPQADDRLGRCEYRGWGWNRTRRILGGSTAGSRGGGGAVILGGSTAGSRGGEGGTACAAGDSPERPAALREARAGGDGTTGCAGWGGLKINNGTPADSRRFCRRWLLVVEVPAQRFSRRGSTRPGWVGRIAACCLWLGSDRTWLKWSSGARRTHHDAVSAISLSEAERPFSDI